MQWKRSLLGSACVLGLAAPGLSQTAEPVVADAQASVAPGDQDIVVTGSRIVRRDFNANSPIITVDQGFIQNSGPATIEQSLNALPQFQPSQGSQTSSIGTSGAGPSAGRATANLRGLGAPRTLVLFDGRRLQPSSTDGTIDLNGISSALVSTVEVITGGASAVYGSDAIAGVVNFRFNNRFRGLELQADSGISSMGDASNLSGSLTWGTDLGSERGRLFLSVSYLERGTASRNAREFFDGRLGTSSPTSGSVVQEGANPFGFGAPAAVLAYRNLFTNVYRSALPPVSSAFFLNADGTLIGRSNASNLRPSPITGYLLDPAGGVLQGGFNDSTLQLPLQRFTAFGRAEYDVGSSATLYFQGSYATYQSDQLSESGVLQSVVGPIRIRADNPFVTPDLRIALNARPNPSAPFTYYFTSTRIGQLRVKEDYDVYQLLGGLRGQIADSLRYDVYVSHGETVRDSQSFNQVSRSRFNALVNGTNSTGQADGGRSQCDGGYDPFGFAPVSSSCAAFLTFDTTNRFRFTQTIAQGNLTGELFDLPGGKAAFAVGAEYRRNEYSADLDPRNSPTPTAVPGVTTPPEALGSSGAFSSGGSIAASEIYAEMLLPLLSERPGFRRLEIDLAYRYSDYDRIGGVHTYKAGGTWSPFDGANLRGGYSRAIRAPSLGDLFSPRTGAIGIIGLAGTGGGDPCDRNGNARSGRVPGVDPARVVELCVAQGIPQNLIATYTYAGTANAAFRVGNPDLKEETADSYTIGAVLQPQFLRPAFSVASLSVDYFNIRLKDAIGFVTSPIALNQCFNFGGQNPTYDNSNIYCQLINRDGAGVLSFIDEPLFNLGSYQTTGIDFQLDLAVPVSGIGTLSLNSAVTYVIDYKIQNLSTEPALNFAGTIGNTQIDGFSPTHPAWRHVTTASLGGRNGSLSLRWRFIAAQDNSANVGNDAGTSVGVPAVSYFDLVGRLVASRQFELRAGITNLTDKSPPEFGGPASTATSTYDVIGRRFFVGVTARY